MKPRILLLVPVHNELATIVAIADRSQAFVDRLLLVDDGSNDGSEALLRTLAHSDERVVLLPHHDNLGTSEALFTGFAYAVARWMQGDLADDAVLITMDGDGQHVPEDIPQALALLDDGADVVLGRRTFENYPWVKRVGNRILTAWASWLSGVRYQDAECGFRAMRMAVVADLLPYYGASRYACCQEIAIITALRGWRIRNDWDIRVPLYRSGTRVSHGFNNAWSALRASVRVRRHRPYRRRGRWQEALTVEAATALDESMRQHGVG